MTLYKIKDWSTRYENNRTRELKRLDWVPVPNGHDGEGYTLTASQKNGAALLGAWLVILQVASRCGTRGTLMRDTGVPHGAVSIARITRLPERVISDALRWFASSEVQWLEIVVNNSQSDLPLDTCDNPAPACGNPASGCLEGKGMEWNGKKGSEGVRAAAAAPASDSEWLADLQKNPAYTALNVPQEFAKMQAWCSANRKAPSRRRFVNWLNRAEKPMQPTAAYRPTVKDGPTGWRDTLRSLYPDNTHDGAWGTLPESLRKMIEQAHHKTP